MQCMHQYSVNLVDLLIYHAKLITETRSEIENLEKDLRIFKGFLKDSVKKRRKDEETKALVQNIRDVVYDVEDFLDAFVTQIIEKKPKNFIQRLLQRPVDFHSIGKQVEEVKKKVERAMNDKANQKVYEDEQETQKPEVRPPRQKDVVGFAEVTDELICRLTKETDYLDVVSLIGMFGLGKTTLAWKIFNDPTIIYEFPVRIWLVVSQEFSKKDIILAILKEFMTTLTEDLRQKDVRELIPIVAGYLESKSFLIVMDDVWSPDHWRELQDCLPKNNYKGKVLITSREVEVGNYASSPRPPHKLRFFTQEESWELLRWEAIRKLDCPPELEGVGQLIATNCGGLPLAIVIIGGILAMKFSASDMSATIKVWDKVSTRVTAELRKCRRLSIHSNCLKFISSKPNGPLVRSFVCLSKDEFTLPAEDIPNILRAFKLLRVLDVKPITFPQINSDIYHLIHVRYLALSLNLSTLPSKFSELWNIQTLIVDTTSRTLEVKADIWKMKQLRHFKTNASATLPKPSKDSKHGAELQTLGRISVESCTADLFDRACNLKKLSIRGKLALLLEGKMGSFDSVGKMKYLEKLKLINDVHPRPASEGQLRSLPQHYRFPSRLRSLTLVATLLSWDVMSSILRLLENLEVLKLKNKAFMGNTWKADGNGFRCLQFLHIEETDLTVWEASQNHIFPKLKGVVLKNCGKLLGIPIELADIASFQMLDLYFCKSAASASAKKIQEKKKEMQPAFKLSIFPPDE
ncbi:hypothetical protein C2S52_018886 [Perilla frutescens var. hirtella]|nr:hypothetical protein C2S52_018886 [Perilla frutescens var. hirtella]